METFLLELPSQIEVARRHLYNSNANLLEHWYFRLEDWVNLFAVAGRRFEETHAPDELVADIWKTFDALQQLHQLFDEALSFNRDAANLPSPNQCPNEETMEGSLSQIGRPRKQVSKEDIEALFNIHRSWKTVANVIGVSQKTLQRRRQECGLTVSAPAGPRQTYTEISQEDLCQFIKEVLQVLPNDGETYVIGACSSRGIFVQRQRVREAIKIVDPISRALRRTVSIVRRVYSVPGPNALW